MKRKIFVSTSSFCKVDKTPQKILEGAGFEVKFNPYGRTLTEEEIISSLKSITGLIAGVEPLTRRVLSSAPNLKAIARVGSGTGNIDFTAAGEFGIKVSSTPDCPVQAVSEMTIAALLALRRKLLPLNASMHCGNWKKELGEDLSGTKIFIIGYGRIGKMVAKLLKAFNVKILVYDPAISKNNCQNGEQIVSFEEGLSKADIITVHMDGKNVLLGRKEFDKMRKGIFLLNSARGELIDERALVEALKGGKIAGAWLDVFAQEPYHGELTKFNQVLLTPHVASYTAQCRCIMEVKAAQNLIQSLQ